MSEDQGDKTKMPAADAARVPAGQETPIHDLMSVSEPSAAQIGASKAPRPGGRIILDAGGEAEVLSRDEGFYQLRFHVEGALESWLVNAGRLPLPPYIRREPGADDAERYQTVFARNVGAVAAPTAGLHFDDALLAALRARGVEFGHVTDEFGVMVHNETVAAGTEDTFTNVEEARVEARAGADTIRVAIDDALFDDAGASVQKRGHASDLDSAPAHPRPSW